MILTDIRDYVKARGRVSSKDLSVRFDMSEAAIDQMMTHLLEPRGKIRRLTAAPLCSGCSSCGGCSSSETPIVYEWVDTPS